MNAYFVCKIAKPSLQKSHKKQIFSYYFLKEDLRIGKEL